MILFDAYTLKARIAPGLLVLLPVVAAALAIFPDLISLPGASVIAACGVAAGLVLETRVRKGGLALQSRLYKEWGAPPTTQMLRHRDKTISALDKARYHQRLAELTRVAMPTPAEETANHDAADEVYDSVTMWLRERTRDASTFPIVVSENASYGFYRNLAALKTTGWVFAVLGALLALGDLSSDGFTLGGLAALFVSIACGVMFWLYAGVEQVRDAGESYAKALIRAIDAVDKPK